MISLADLASAFSVYTALVVAAAVVVLGRYLPGRVALEFVAGLAVWVIFSLIIGASGVAGRNASVPPGIAILLIPAFVLVLATALSPAGRVLSTSVPLVVLTAFQIFRIGVEMTLTALAGAGKAPHLMTLSGGNFEILVAISAPFMAWAATRERRFGRLLLGWNLLGLLSLANVASRAVLTAPGPLHLVHAEVPDVAILTFPFTFIPGLVAPLAVLIHLVAIRSLGRRKVTVRREVTLDFSKPV